MSEIPSANILILARHHAAARRWTEMLEGPESRVRVGVDEPAGPVPPDVILTDRIPPGESHTGDRAGDELGQPGPDAVGVIRIGCQGPADVQLPADVTERELRLACRLLAQVVRLRRKEQIQHRMQHRLVEQALTDPLTGLPNRREWDQTLRERLAAVGEGPGRLCLAIFDLDHFKSINDVHGHAAGDALLSAVGKLFVAGLRDHDFVARLGGDEFGLLLSVADVTTARAVIERVRVGLPKGLAGHPIHAVTASAGFALTPGGNDPSFLSSLDTLFDQADAALREAKRQGRDRVVGAVDG